jgi:hypothetical protein
VLFGRLFPLDDHRDGAGGEQAADDQVCGRDLGSRPAQRAHFDRNQRGRVRWPGQQVIVQTRERGRARHAAEAGHRQPLDVRPQPQPRDQQSVGRRDRNARDRCDDQQVQIPGENSSLA